MGKDTYGQLASKTVPGLYSKAFSMLSHLTKSVQPGDVKHTRQSLLYARNALDVFAYAYPTSGKNFKKNDDPLVYIRDELNVGYTIVGMFQDLEASGVHYTKKECDHLRDAVLDWKDKFLAKAKEHDFEHYLGHPQLRSIVKDRKASALSQFFWRDTGVVPHEKHSGMWNLVELERALLILAVEAYGPLVRISNILHVAEQVQAHAYRKQIRAILDISTSFALWPSTKDTDTASATLEKAYSDMGDLENRINAYLFYRKHGHKSELKKAERELLKQWDKLLAWLLDGQILTAVGTLVGALTTHV